MGRSRRFWNSSRRRKIARVDRRARDKDYLGKLTPIVEDELEKKIGIQCPWEKENLSAYLVELLTELNERTPYYFSL
jgi:hypothetical protein